MVEKDSFLNKMVASILESEQPIIYEFHKRATENGLLFKESKSKKMNYHKIEYKKDKKDDNLFIISVKGSEWSLHCKLYNLEKYQSKLKNLRKNMYECFMSSRRCKDSKRLCTVGIKIIIKKEEIMFCRHGIHFKKIIINDIDSLWVLIMEESKLR